MEKNVVVNTSNAFYKKIKIKNRGLKCLPDTVQFIVIKPLDASNSVMKSFFQSN